MVYRCYRLFNKVLMETTGTGTMHKLKDPIERLIVEKSISDQIVCILNVVEFELYVLFLVFFPFFLVSS